jgi:serine/threonine protein kinase
MTGTTAASAAVVPVIPQITNWRKGELLGQGAYGQVFLGLNTDTGQLLAVKQVQLSRERTKTSDQLISALESEIALMSGLVHENIVRYVGSQRSPQHLNIFLEFVSGGSLASVLKSFGRFSEKLVKLYCRQILAGLEYLHRNNIIHRDIKGANILLTQEGLVKVSVKCTTRDGACVAPLESSCR